MHFQLPKPLHGWREFVGEVGIIVIGVLIALGAEQLVEDWRWSHETEAARAALRREAADNLQAARTRVQLQPCVDRRLKEIAAMFADHAAGRPIHLHGLIGRPISYYGSTDAWQVEIASQALSHMPLQEKLAIGTAFSNYENMNSVLRLEQEPWRRLDVLNNPDQLEAGDWPPLRQAFADASSLNSRLEIITGDILVSYTIGQAPKRLQSDPASVAIATKQFCTPILEQSRRQTAKSAA
jgi:hypothetical protein